MMITASVQIKPSMAINRLALRAQPASRSIVSPMTGSRK